VGLTRAFRRCAHRPPLRAQDPSRGGAHEQIVPLLAAASRTRARAARAPPSGRSTAARSHSVERARRREAGGAAAARFPPPGHGGRRLDARKTEGGGKNAARVWTSPVAGRVLFPHDRRAIVGLNPTVCGAPAADGFDVAQAGLRGRPKSRPRPRLQPRRAVEPLRGCGLRAKTGFWPK